MLAVKKSMTTEQEEMVERINLLLNQANSDFFCVMCLGSKGEQGMVVRRMENGYSTDHFVDPDSKPYIPEINSLIDVYKQALGVM